MFGIEKAFGKTERGKAGEKSVPVSGLENNGEPEGESEIVFFNQSIEKGQTWETEDGKWEITIVNHNTGSDRYEIVEKDKKTGSSESLLESSEEIKARLLVKRYELCAQNTKPLAAGDKVSLEGFLPKAPPEIIPAPLSAPQSKEETVPAMSAALPEEAEQSRIEALSHEYVTLDQQMVMLLEEKIDSLGTLIGETIEKNAEILGEKREEFYSTRDVIIESIDSLVAEENVLVDIFEKNGKNVTEDLLEVRRENHKKMLVFYAELEALYVFMNQEITKNEAVAEVKEVEEKKVAPAQSSSVIDINEYRESKEKNIDAEQKIGKEKYDALIQMVENTWQSLESELQNAKIPHRVLDKIWTTEVLPDLKGRMEKFLRKRTDIEQEECQSICVSIMKKISEKK